MTISISIRRLVEALVTHPEALKVNARAVARRTGMARQTITRHFSDVRKTLHLHYVAPTEVRVYFESAFIAMKLVDNAEREMYRLKTKLLQEPNVFSLYFVEGTNYDILVKVIAKNHSSFHQFHKSLKNIDNVKSADLAFRIYEDFPTSSSEADLFLEEPEE